MLYGAVLLASAWLADVVGSAGLYGIAMIGGLSDVDPINRALGLRHRAASTEQAAIAIALAISNLALNALVFVAGDSVIGRQCAVPLIATLLATLLGLAIFL